MRVCLFSAFATAIALSGLPGQAQADLPVFEVASIKPSSPQGGRMEINGIHTYPGGRFVVRGCTLDYLIQIAFDIQPFQILGGPGWASVERFEIEGRPPASSLSAKGNPLSAKSPPNAEQRQMLQAL